MADPRRARVPFRYPATDAAGTIGNSSGVWTSASLFSFDMPILTIQRQKNVKMATG